MVNKLAEQIVLLFDVDGVIAETPHEQSWKAAAVEWGIIDDRFDFTAFYAEKIAGEPGEVGAYHILSELKATTGKSYFEKHGITDKAEKVEEAKEFRDPIKRNYIDQFIKGGQFKAFYDIGRIILEAKNAGISIGAVSSSEMAQTILKSISALEIAQTVGVPYTCTNADDSLYAVFDSTALGTKTQWHNIAIDKHHHYCYARGMLIEARKRTQRCGEGNIPYVIVFEDAPKGINAISPIDFYCIGISRTSSSGVQLATKHKLIDAGAIIAYDGDELKNITLNKLLAVLEEKLPRKKKMIR